MPVLVPEYLNIDFNTLISRLKDEIKDSNTFRDFNYEGSNIAIIIELLAYVGELNTYYINKLAKNAYFDTVEIFENAHRLGRLVGYKPKGYRSGRATVTVTIPSGASVSVDDVIRVDAWKEITTTEEYENEAIKYSTTTGNTFTVDSIPYSFNLNTRQGNVTRLTGYYGRDLIDNELVLPIYNYSYDDDNDDDYPTIEVTVDGDVWTRVSDFYDDLSGLYTEDDVYEFRYDRYKRSKIVFSDTRNIPGDSDEISIIVLKSLGVNGSIGAETITTPETQFVYNDTTAAWVDSSTLTVSNSAASIGSADPETVEDIKINAPLVLHTQYRNVTKKDYKTNLETRSDVAVANIWGEQEIAPSGSTSEFNKVHISVIPQSWGTSSIETSASSAGFIVPLNYSNTYRTTLSTFLEPRKMLNAYEYFELPELVYFYFDIGVKIKRTYSYASVLSDLRNKLTYYFSSSNREFNETISFIDITNYILDYTNVSTTDNFTSVKGIQNLIFRDINCSLSIYEPNDDNNYPQYTVTASTYIGDNKLRKIQLGYDQFPMLSLNLSTFTQET
uniref:Putative baseplate protein n=1 Tax=viral metagenome TaxID=1070528 RepID=A0A6M3K791_9ZZZZ